jgi:dihydrofolate reductase
MTEYIIVVAIAENGVIGRAGKLPWHLPSDLKHFKKTTMGNPLLMGRNTFESIGKPLPGRDNLVLTRNEHYQFPGCIVLNSVEEALDFCRKYEKVFIIGGGDIFKITLDITDVIIVTQLKREVEGDVFFPEIDPSKFKIIDSVDYDIEEPYSIIRYEKIK